MNHNFTELWSFDPSRANSICTTSIIICRSSSRVSSLSGSPRCLRSGYVKGGGRSGKQTEWLANQKTGDNSCHWRYSAARHPGSPESWNQVGQKVNRRDAAALLLHAGKSAEGSFVSEGCVLELYSAFTEDNMRVIVQFALQRDTRSVNVPICGATLWYSGTMCYSGQKMNSASHEQQLHIQREYMFRGWDEV